MPLHHPDMYGTAANGMPIEDYCVHCFRDGGFTSDVTMEEMMRLCANYVDGNTRFYIASMKTLYPHLKRWAKKENTESEYYKSINRVLDHVKANLHEQADLKTLAGIARISPYHFHRIFKSVIGEPIGEYVNRMRMEYVAERLKTSGLSLAELAGQAGYSSEQALSRAFKSYFGLPPRAFKTTFFKETFGRELKPRICKVAAKKVIMLRGLPDQDAWNRLYMYALVNRLLSDTIESIEVIQNESYRPALTTGEGVCSGRHAESLMLQEGLYAIFTHRGEFAAIEGLYAAVRNYWLPAGKYTQAPAYPYVVFLNNAMHTPKEELLSELYFPVIEKRG